MATSRNRRTLRWLAAILRHSRRFDSLEVRPWPGPNGAGRMVFIACRGGIRHARFVRPWQIKAAWKEVAR